MYRSVVIFVMLCTSLNLSNYKFAKFGCDEESMNGPDKYLKLALSFLLNHLITRNHLKLSWILFKRDSFLRTRNFYVFLKYYSLVKPFSRALTMEFFTRLGSSSIFQESNLFDAAFSRIYAFLFLNWGNLSLKIHAKNVCLAE